MNKASKKVKMSSAAAKKDMAKMSPQDKFKAMIAAKKKPTPPKKKK